jgi:ABC-type polysaccharide/polyol phosphate transport system ATPase subunit
MIDLDFEHVSKKYTIREAGERGPARPLLARALDTIRRPTSSFWALRDVSFQVETGEALGIIGHNGAGKSTILKLLSGITVPTSGTISIRGRLSSLIEVGSGFHPELTGRENIYLNGSILGMRRREISSKIDSILEFAGVEQFADTPVKRYSSGMYVRLGFSIAAHLEAEILLLDEVLAVGDMSFQAKCLQRVDDLRRSGTTIVFISHDLAAVSRLCSRVLLMHRGQLVRSGAAADVIAEYKRTALGEGEEHADGAAGAAGRAASIYAVTYRTAEGGEPSALRTGEPLLVRVDYTVEEPIADAVLAVYFVSPHGEVLCQCTTEVDPERIALERGDGSIDFAVPALGLQPGLYHVRALIRERGAARPIDCRDDVKMPRVDRGRTGLGRFYMPYSWRNVQHSVAEGAAPGGADTPEYCGSVSSPRSASVEGEQTSST